MPKQRMNKNQEFSSEFMTKLNGPQLAQAFGEFVTMVKREQRKPSYSTRSYFQRQEDAALAKGRLDAHGNVDLNENANGASGSLRQKNAAPARMSLEQFFGMEKAASGVDTILDPPGRTLPAGSEARCARLCVNPGRNDCPVCHGLGNSMYKKAEKANLKKAKADLADQLAKLKALAAAHLATFENE